MGDSQTVLKNLGVISNNSSYAAVLKSPPASHLTLLETSWAAI